MVHDSSSHAPLPTPPTRPRHTLKNTLIIRLELAEPSPVLDLEPKKIDTGARVFFGVVSALATRLDLAVTPFFGEPCETGFEGSTAGMVVCECGVDAEGVADSEGFEVGFEGVTNEDRGGALRGCEEGEEVRLDLSEGGRGGSKGCFRDP